MVKSLASKLNAAVWVIIISNLLGGLAFIVAFFILKEWLLLIGGIFVMSAGVTFKLLIQKYIDKIQEAENRRNQQK